MKQTIVIDFSAELQELRQSLDSKLERVGFNVHTLTRDVVDTFNEEVEWQNALVYQADALVQSASRADPCVKNDYRTLATHLLWLGDRFHAKLTELCGTYTGRLPYRFSRLKNGLLLLERET